MDVLATRAIMTFLVLYVPETLYIASSVVEGSMALTYPSPCVSSKTPNSLNASRPPRNNHNAKPCSLPRSYTSSKVPAATSSLQSYVDVKTWHSPLPSPEKAPHPSKTDAGPFRFVCHPSLRFLESGSCQSRRCLVDSRYEKGPIPNNSICIRCRPICYIRQSTRKW